MNSNISQKYTSEYLLNRETRSFGRGVDDLCVSETAY